MNSAIKTIGSKINSSKIDSELKTWLIDYLASSKEGDPSDTTSSSNLNSRIDVLVNKIDLQKTEINSKLYNYNQNQLAKSNSAKDSRVDNRKVKEKLRQQQEIFNRSLDRSAIDYFGDGSKLMEENKSIVDSITELKENLKTKKNQLLIPEDVIERIENNFKEETADFWNRNLKNLNKYGDRNTVFVEKELAAHNMSQDLRAVTNSENEKYLELYNQAKETEFEKISSEINKKRIGDYLMRARMFPMYILMGSSMLGLSINRGPAAKFIAPLMIFLMGLGFYMIYVSREKEEKDEKEKALITIKDKLLSETNRRSKGFSEKAKDYTEKEIKRINENLNNYFDAAVELRGERSNKAAGRVRTDSRLKSDLETKVKSLEDLKRDITKLKK